MPLACRSLLCLLVGLSHTMLSINNAHDDLVHDAVLDYYGKRLATCSSDKTVKIFGIENNDQHTLLTTLTGHSGPVWQVGWAHPKFGIILATCSYDGEVFIWKEEAGVWAIIAKYSEHTASVNSISWSPPEYGPLLLCTSSDGKASVLEFNSSGKINSFMFDAHSIGVNTGTWAPCRSDPKNIGQRRIITGGCDNLVKIWKFNDEGSDVQLEHTLTGHTDWVRDVAWSPSNLGKSYIATASQDRSVLIWTKDNDSNEWKKQPLTKRFSDVCWRASWSLSGNILAISGNDKVTLWKETLDGDWESAGEVVQSTE